MITSTVTTIGNVADSGTTMNDPEVVADLVAPGKDVFESEV
jgi:hypothetical protein